MRGITAKAGLWVLPVIAVLLLAACADTTATPVPPALPQSTATALPSPTVAPTTTIAPTNPATTAAAPTATAVPAQPSEVVNPAVTQIIEQKGTAVISTDTVVPPTAITPRSSIPSATPVPPKATVAPATGPTTQPAAGLGIIKGRVTAGPTCPVERAENPCPPAPIANRAVQIRDQSGNSVILTLTTDSQGYFQGQLAAGTYLLTIMSSGALPRDPNGPHRVTVNAGQTANVDIRLDTGIR